MLAVAAAWWAIGSCPACQHAVSAVPFSPSPRSTAAPGRLASAATHVPSLGRLSQPPPAAAAPQPTAAPTGLDSATTFSVVRFLGELSRTMQATTVVSLLQPSGDVLALFDDLMLLDGG